MQRHLENAQHTSAGASGAPPCRAAPLAWGLRAFVCISPVFRGRTPCSIVLQVSDGFSWTQWTPRALFLLAMTRNRPTVSCDPMLQNDLPVRLALPRVPFRTCSHVKELWRPTYTLLANMCAACADLRVSGTTPSLERRQLHESRFSVHDLKANDS